MNAYSKLVNQEGKKIVWWSRRKETRMELKERKGEKVEKRGVYYNMRWKMDR